MPPQSVAPVVHANSALLSLLVGMTALILVAGGLAVWYLSRRAVVRAWQRFALEVEGEFKAKNTLAPERVLGTLNNRPFVLETALSHDDDAPYYHTRAAFPVRNPSTFIMGVRRKSLLEEAQTRRDAAAFDLNDPDFERHFFVVCNEGAHLPAILTEEVRRELSRYADIEIYARLSEIEWRRAGAQGDLRVIRRLNELLSQMATTIDGLPKRTISLTDRMAAEELIAKGI